MLRAWWKTEQLPPIGRLTVPQARLVLDRIAALEWDCRPFGPSTE